MPGIEVRAGRPEEAVAVIEAYRWLFEPPGSVPPDWDPETAKARWLAAVEDEWALALIAAEGERITGLCTGYVDIESVRFGRRCWVEDLAVDPARRSEGVGAALLEAARDWARGRGCTHLELDSGEARTDAHRFYEREGGGWRSLSYSWWLAE